MPAMFVLLVTVTGASPSGFSRVVFFSDWLLTLVIVGGFRVAIRVVHEPDLIPGRQARSVRHAKRTLIVGAGAAGTLVAREMRRNPQLRMKPVGFLDDDGGKIGKSIAGLSAEARTRRT